MFDHFWWVQLNIIFFRQQELRSRFFWGQYPISTRKPNVHVLADHRCQQCSAIRTGCSNSGRPCWQIQGMGQWSSWVIGATNGPRNSVILSIQPSKNYPICGSKHGPTISAQGARLRISASAQLGWTDLWITLGQKESTKSLVNLQGLWMWQNLACQHFQHVPQFCGNNTERTVAISDMLWYILILSTI